MKRENISFIFMLTAFFLFITIAGAYAQEDRFEKYKSIKVAYITDQINLTPDEAEVFWPVYNDFENKRNKIHEERMKLTEYFSKNSETLQEAEISKILDDYIGFYKAENELMIEYNNKLKDILSPVKVMKLHIAEIQFRHYLIEKIKEQRGRERGPSGHR
jgi:hypothetical protein